MDDLGGFPIIFGSTPTLTLYQKPPPANRNFRHIEPGVEIWRHRYLHRNLVQLIVSINSSGRWGNRSKCLQPKKSWSEKNFLTFRFHFEQLLVKVATLHKMGWHFEILLSNLSIPERHLKSRIHSWITLDWKGGNPNQTGISCILPGQSKPRPFVPSSLPPPPHLSSPKSAPEDKFPGEKSWVTWGVKEMESSPKGPMIINWNKQMSHNTFPKFTMAQKKKLPTKGPQKDPKSSSNHPLSGASC